MLFVMRLKKRIMFFFCLFDLAGISRQSVSEILQLKLKIGRKKCRAQFRHGHCLIGAGNVASLAEVTQK